MLDQGSVIAGQKMATDGIFRIDSLFLSAVIPSLCHLKKGATGLVGFSPVFFHHLNHNPAERNLFPVHVEERISGIERVQGVS